MPGIEGSTLTRRELLRLSATGAVLAGLPGCATERRSDGRADSGQVARPTGVGDDAWAGVRAQFLLDSRMAYLNNASLGKPPRVVSDAVGRGYEAISRDPHRGKAALEERIAEQVLPGLARLFGVKTGEIALSRNATEALHLQTVGAVLSPGDEVVITTQEHPAGRRPWLLRRGRDAIDVKEVFVPSPLPPTSTLVDLMAEAMGPRTRALAFCHVTRGGHRYPVRELCHLARERGVLSLIDGAQAVGQFPIHLGDLGCDAYSASLHKWLLGPVGTGFFFVREDARDRIVSDYAPDATILEPAFAPPGTVDLPVRAALGEAIDFVEQLGLDQVEARCRFLSDYLKSRLVESPQVTLLSSATDQSAPGSTIFEIEGLDALAAVPMIASTAGAHIDEHQRDGHNAIRISTHVYNTTVELDRVVEHLISGPR